MFIQLERINGQLGVVVGAGLRLTIRNELSCSFCSVLQDGLERLAVPITLSLEDLDGLTENKANLPVEEKV